MVSIRQGGIAACLLRVFVESKSTVRGMRGSSTSAASIDRRAFSLAFIRCTAFLSWVQSTLNVDSISIDTNGRTFYSTGVVDSDVLDGYKRMREVHRQPFGQLIEVSDASATVVAHIGKELLWSHLSLVTR